MAGVHVYDHLAAITAVRPARRYECDECVKTGDRWVYPDRLVSRS